MRWAFAGAGIAAVVLVVILFAALPGTPFSELPLIALWRRGGAALGFGFLISAVIGVFLTRDWRAAFFIALPPWLSATVAALFADAVGLPQAGAAPLIVGGAFGAALCAILADRFIAHRAFDDRTQFTFRRTLDDCAAPILAAALALFFSALLLATAHFTALTAAIVIAFETALAPVLFAILAACAYDLYPRRRWSSKSFGIGQR